jgi:hypothetical protein
VLMKKVPAMWVGLGVAGFTAGALVMGIGGECTTTFCWGGASPGLLMILAGVLAAITVSRRLPALGTGVVGGGLTGLTVSLGAGASVLFSGSSAAGAPASISPIVLTILLGSILGLVGAMVGTTARPLIRPLRRGRIDGEG